MFMVFCSYCGEKLPDGANFCTKCGFRTKLGVEAGVTAPTEDWREAFSKMGIEMEKAFQTAAKEIQKALKNVKEDTKEARRGQPVVCKSCGEKSPANAVFCTKCGQKVE
jgi:ribosomal protein L40E